ncbi:Por secretion system C-terminal sorting domain-containing protein [Catalinimonas alkaloidigena]|uniref:Por secretion system C-terminal sorting domain-containing protein n=1 Tax=Catalinimonas alkaloidigena TaxID=1075417 RepID=A0A1G9PHZ4_9BACT|nr:CHRD domain-containing protein [Catalinimonas alkaloidigena]SDL98418.1 Por secretion system C-terminal sorting domain-containing protein [Catalinimonas alkaloidigena]
MHTFFTTLCRTCFLMGILVTAPTLAQTYKAYLGGANEVLPVATMGHGEITAELTGTTVTVTGSFTGLSSKFTASHLHLALAGTAGDVVFPLTPTIPVDSDSLSGTFEAADNTIPLSEEQVMAMMNRQIYVNLHSVMYPNGEIRGQVVPEADAYYRANLFGSNEVPAVATQASGSVFMELHADTLVVTGSYMNLSSPRNPVGGTGAHLHAGKAGMNGGVVIPLNPTPGPDGTAGTFEAANNTVKLTADQLVQLRSRGLYANIHSEMYGFGEIRGQVVSGMANAVFVAHLSGTNENPAVTTTAHGAMVLEVMDMMVMTSGSFMGLESDYAASHLHTGLAGANGPVAFPLAPALEGDQRGGTFGGDSNQVELTQAQYMAMFERMIYANVHSANHSGGEIRGQVVPESQYFVVGHLSGAQQVHPVASLGSGAVLGEIQGNQLTVTGSFMDLMSDFNANVAGGAHLHMAYAGQNGPVVFPLVTDVEVGNRSGMFMADSNQFTLDSAQRVGLLKRHFYANIHSTDHPDGELRGQMLPQATALFIATLSGASQTPPVKSMGSGTLIGELHGTTLMVSGAFMDLSSGYVPNVAAGSGAHLHLGLDGMAGGVVVPLNVMAAAGDTAGVVMADSNSVALTAGQLDTLRMRMHYANVHTEAYPSGEIRGQMLPLATSYLTATLQGMNENPPVMTDAMGSLKLEINGEILTVTGSFKNLDSTYVNSHLHVGAAGRNGGVKIPLVATVNPDSLGGMYLAADNRSVISMGVADSLVRGLLYANVHSKAHSGGEIRGQVLKESNFFPMATSITSPADEAEITIEGPDNQEFSAMWDAAADPDGNRVVYYWQLAADSGFALMVVNALVDTNTAFVTDYGTVDSLLALAGVGVDQQVTLYHRVVSSDGSLMNMAMDVPSVMLTRGVVVTDADELLSQFLYGVYPSPTAGRATLLVEAERASQGQIVVTDLMGRMVSQRDIRLRSGRNEFPVELARQSPGIYFVTLAIEGQPLPVRKVVKQ